MEVNNIDLAFFSTFVQMIKKFSAIILYVLACSIQFAHSAIPHGHSHHHHSDHHHHDEDHQESEREQSIFDLFSHFHHSAESFSGAEINNLIIIDDSTLFNNCVTIHYSNAPIQGKEPSQTFTDEPDIFLSPHSKACHFRGPPSS